MAKKCFEPKIGSGCKDFCTRKSNQEQASLPKVIKEGMPKGGISSEKVARNFMLNHFKRIEEAFEIPADLRDKVIEAVIEADKKILIDSGFQNFIPKAEKALKAYVTAAEIPTDDDTDIAKTASATPELESTDDASASDASAPAEGTPAPEAPASDPSAIVPTHTDVMVDENADTDEDESDKHPATKPIKKKNWLAWLAIFIVGLVLGFICAFALQFAGGTNENSHGDAATDGTVAYSYNGYLMLDYGAKSTITVRRDATKNVGHNVTLLMDSTFYTDENGNQWLRYTSATTDVSIEVLAPIFPDGSMSLINDWQKTVDKRNRQFGLVELIWNGNQCTVVFTNARVSYDLVTA